uniref:Uncharacterized protein n=1 Tax=Arundo donax TaxID=35708 RepID=A0A0A8ZWY6_ARUDO
MNMINVIFADYS